MAALFVFEVPGGKIARFICALFLIQLGMVVALVYQKNRSASALLLDKIEARQAPLLDKLEAETLLLDK